MKVVWSPRAIQRATDIAKYIATDDPEAAARWVDAVFDKVDAIPPFPARAARVKETGRSDIRQVFHGEYRIIFRFGPDRIDVLTVRHGGQQLPPGDIGGNDS